MKLLFPRGVIVFLFEQPVAYPNTDIYAGAVMDTGNWEFCPPFDTNRELALRFIDMSIRT